MVSTQVNIPGYQVSEQLYNGSRTLVYRAVREIEVNSTPEQGTEFIIYLPIWASSN
ncbi:MAG: ATP-binding protein [Gloeotrichia echinulata IR180]|jgi:hypothetical protein|nr:ATP-binding protein [Gloeotrichia echinulata DEX184]